MKKSLLLFAIVCIWGNTQAQTAGDFVVKASSQVISSPPSITIMWEPFNASYMPDSIHILRKLKSESSFNTLIKSIFNNMSTTLSFTDNNVAQGVQYEYMIEAFQSTLGSIYGVLNAGINISEVHSRGGLFLVIDSLTQDSMPLMIDTLYSDLVGDGWNVTKKVIGSLETVTTLKNKISLWYNANASQNKAVYLFGRVPVPYSGNFDGSSYPSDGHTPQHNGAWVADAVYADIDGGFNDLITNTTGIVRVENMNNPGDGKFDENTIPSMAELQVGRVYLGDLPTITGKTENQMLFNYLKKAHNFKQANTQVLRRALTCEKLNSLGGEAPGRVGFTNFTPLVGFDSVDANANYMAPLTAGSYLFSHASNFASYTNIGSIVNAGDYNTPIKSVFNLFFGSYHGDWDIQNNLMRTSMATGDYSLTACWAGRPMWYFHHMGMGENIGYSTLNTLNNFMPGNQTYYPGFGNNRVHVNLLGDPTLRLHYVKPVTNVVAVPMNSNHRVKLDWNASTDDSIIGYHVYRSDSITNTFTKINNQIITGTTFWDATPLEGTNLYMIRAVKNETSSTGTYNNLSQGAFVKIYNVDGITNNSNTINYSMKIYPNPAKSNFTIETNEFYDKTEVSLTDILGKSVDIKYSVNNEQINVSTNGLPNGIYILKLNTIKGTLVSKVQIGN